MRLPTTLLALVASASFAAAQSQAPIALSEARQAQAVPTDYKLDLFRAKTGLPWRMQRDRDTGWVRFLWGGAMQPEFAPASELEYVSQARAFLGDTEELHGIDGEGLRFDKSVFLPLGRMGSSDKMTVRFLQEEAGVAVLEASVNVLMDANGRLLSIDTQALPRLSGFDVNPSVDAAVALETAREAFRQGQGVWPNSIGEPQLAIHMERADKDRTGVLVWSIELGYRASGEAMRGKNIRVAADGPLRVVKEVERIHHFDVFGTVSSLVTPGLLPDTGANLPVSEPMAFIEVDTSAGTVTTDENGDFVIPGVNTSVSATIRYNGPFLTTDDAQGAEYELNTVLAANVQNDLLMNSPAEEAHTAEANVFHHIVMMREYIKSVNPFDTVMDFQVSATTNNFEPLTCNATFDGFGINFYQSESGCTNSAFSTIIQHEMGHFLNQLYGSFNASDGIGEGGADVWALYASDTPIIGQDFFGVGIPGRSGLNMEPFCGDNGQGCYGGPHANGLPLMGALWKVRENLNASLGGAAGDMAADLLLNGWYNAYDDTQLLSIIEEHWLALDDDNGNIEDGTPNYEEIDAGFVTQGFPGFELTFLNLSAVTEIQNSRDENGPYGVAANITSATGAAVSSATVYYRIDGGSFQLLPMGLFAPDIYTALIPGVAAPSFVEYYVEAEDVNGDSNRFPKGAPEELLGFRVAQESVYYEDSFDGATDNGWFHIETATQDDWQRDTPTGQSGIGSNVSWADPPAAFSAPFCWGNDLGISGFNGAHQPLVDNSLFSPSLDLSAASGARLEFKRWLNVERGMYDQVYIKVDGAQVWTNPFDFHILDKEWTDFGVDISSEVDGDSDVELEFQLVTDGGLEMGGWSIDDLRIVSYDAVSSTCLPVNYGSGLAGVQGVPSLDSKGLPSRLGEVVPVALKNGAPGSAVVLSVGFAEVDVPFLGGSLLVDPFRNFLRATDVFGQSTLNIALPNDNSLLGVDVFWQGFVIDPSLTEGFSITPGMKLTLCD